MLTSIFKLQEQKFTSAKFLKRVMFAEKFK